MSIPDNLKYSKDHEWVLVEGNTATIGITDHAQSALGDIVYVELPDEGDDVAKDEAFGTVESTKAVSECISPLNGSVTAINDELEDKPETVNQDPYGEGWMIKVEIEDASELDELMGPEAYESLLAESD